MPANLPPTYYEEEKRLRDAKNPDDKIAIIERMLAIIPHHKGTDHLIAQLRSRISKLKEEKERRPQAQRKIDLLYNVKKEGAGQVLFIGFPNSGKSAVVGALSGEPLEVADYPYTTRILQTRMMRYQDIWIQLVDTPALGDESQSMWFGNMLRKADAIVAVVALSEALETEYELVFEEIKSQLPYIDTASALLIVVTKADLTEFTGSLKEFEKKSPSPGEIIPVSVTQDMNLHILNQKLFEKLGVIRVYSKLPGKKPDFDAPFVLKKGSTTLDLAVKVHKDFVAKFRYAKLWRHAQSDGMMVSKDFVLQDKDVLELHL
ncbi:MAG TPA: GTPase [Syntrophorhabdales bacterium]|nr:GTPase [Syntrophorhabdales bacterium]